MSSMATLPDVPTLFRICQSIAMLDAILCPEWQYRYYLFNSKWAEGQQMASMRDGCGDSYFVLFNQHGAMLKGYAHESAAARWVIEHNEALPGMFDRVPEEFSEFLSEPGFAIHETTFCRWRRHGDQVWTKSEPSYPPAPDPGGETGLLAILEGDPERYQRWAMAYYEVPVNLAAVQRIYAHEPLTHELVHALNAAVTLEELAADIDEIGYR